MIFLWAGATVFGHVQLAGHSFAATFAKINALFMIGISAWFAIQIVHAVALYQKLGFRVVRESMVRARRGWPAEPEYHMERPAR